MSLLDLEFRHLAMSPTFVARFMIPSEGDGEQDQRRPVAEKYPAYAAIMQNLRRRLSAGEAVVEFEQTFAVADGSAFDLRSQASYWRDNDGRPVAILIVHQEMTAERQARCALAESEAQLRAVVDNIPGQLSVVDLDAGEIMLMNPAMRAGLATLNMTLPGSPVDNTLTAAHKRGLDKIIAIAEANGGSAEYEEDDDSGRTFRMKFVLFVGAQGRRYLLWLADDVTAARSAADALRIAAEQAEAANRAKSEFLANMSHEIRTPLNGVMGVAGALSRTPLASAQQEMVSIIAASAQTLETLLSDILDLSRIEAGKLELSLASFDLAASVNACAELFVASAQAKGLDLAVVIAPDALGAYVGDAVRIRQILCNLLGNAVKFTQAGSVELSVGARHGDARSGLLFEVRDSGIGFDADTKGRLFSRFEQADGSITRRFGGSGLGLAISHSLATAMGGRIEADAKAGEGAVFALTLELARCTATPEPWHEPAEAEADSDLDPLVGLRVLLAEDHPVNRRVVELILCAAGVDLTCVENGAEAVEAFRTEAFDLILMDMQMPVMDGLTAIREIRGIEAAGGADPMPILMLTANALPEHVGASIAAGANGHFSKPILPDALLERVSGIAAELRSGRPDQGLGPTRAERLHSI